MEELGALCRRQLFLTVCMLWVHTKIHVKSSNSSNLSCEKKKNPQSPNLLFECTVFGALNDAKAKDFLMKSTIKASRS